MPPLPRRDFLSAWGGAVAGAALLGTSSCSRDSPAAAQATRGIDLECRWLDTTLDGTRVRLRSYNGQVPGPLMELRPGDSVRVHVRNSLTPYDSTGWTGDHNVPHRINSTNLHLHGLDITPHLFDPVGTKDPLARMIAINPGESKDIPFKLPSNHPSGLYWYHPHLHGATAIQATSGMAGGLIVRGPIDEVPEVKAAREILLVLNDIGLFPSETTPDLWIYEPVQNAVWSTFGSEVNRWNPASGKMEPAPDLKGGFTTGDFRLRYFLVNGRPYFKEEHNDKSPTDPTPTQLQVPRFTMRPGEVVRFRMLNANSDNLMPIVVQGHQVFLLALDGVNFAAPRTLPVEPIDGSYGGEQFLLAPSNRAEFLVQAGGPGIYQIVQLQQSQQFLQSVHKKIAEIEVAGPPMQPPMGIPTTLPLPSRNYPLIDPKQIRQRRNVVFSGAFPGVLNPIIGVDFMINNMLYDELACPTVVEVGSVEEWKLSIPDMSHGGTEGHPFHVHDNSFEVISIAGKPVPPGTIKDTQWIDAGTTVVIRMKFQEFTGKTVFHCHILPHEDSGMMQNLLIL